jgi:hypothetical protein
MIDMSDEQRAELSGALRTIALWLSAEPSRTLLEHHAEGGTYHVALAQGDKIVMGATSIAMTPVPAPLQPRVH